MKRPDTWFALFLIIFACHIGLVAQETSTATENPRFSPDGKQFVFSTSVWKKGADANTKVSAAIAIVNIDGTKYRLLTQNTTGISDGEASVSPDGKKIVFRRIKQTDNTAEPGDIYIINADGTGLRQLTNQSANETHPEFSIDSKNVIFVREYYAGANIPTQGELISVNLQDFKEQILIRKEIRVIQAIPIPTGRGGFLIACAELDENAKPLPKGSMLAIASPIGELDPRGFMKLPMPEKKLEITRIHASFAPTETAFYVAAKEEGWFSDSHAFKITPKEVKILPAKYTDVRYYLSLSPDGKRNVTGTSYPADTLIVREFVADDFAGKETRIKIQK